MKQSTTKISRQDLQLAKGGSPFEIGEGKAVRFVSLDAKDLKKFLKRAQQSQWSSYAIATVSFAQNSLFEPGDVWYAVSRDYAERSYYSYDIYNFLNKIATSKKEKRLVEFIKKLADSYYEYKIKKYKTMINKGKYYTSEDSFSIERLHSNLKRNRQHFLNLADFMIKNDTEGFKNYLKSVMFDKRKRKPSINEISLNYKAYYHAFRKIDAKYPHIVEGLNGLLAKYNMKLKYKNSMVLCWDGYPAVLEPTNFIDTVKMLHKDYIDALDNPSRVLDFHKVIHRFLIFFEASYKAPYVFNGVFDPFFSEDIRRKAAMVEPVFDNGHLYMYIIPLKDFLAVEL